MARCPKVNVNLPLLFAKQPCLEEENHESPCRWTMTREEINTFFQTIDDAEKTKEEK